ncbi:hypothetical protein [Lachnobacterium bovis]|jgi:hypothetical protein|uniref:Uncharacterized protein n=1 Tax=Lachnobacterium bovis TaxID=140626 RepID=A0A1H9R4M9_9FIRM|nr:hypothetical protein [Lachnobacterium bovis]SER67658.1 hypothetical protein SAMN02910429_00768 [Lachnobacterium bovis]
MKKRKNHTKLVDDNGVRIEKNSFENSFIIICNVLSLILVILGILAIVR